MATTTHRIGPADHGRRMTLDEFIDADLEGGRLYGVIVVTEVPSPRHGRIVRCLTRLFIQYDETHPGVIRYGACGSDCRLRLPGMQSDRHPDQAIYLDPQPPGSHVWSRWVPHLVVEVVSPGAEDRDYVEKREEYLLAGVSEYWIVDPVERRLVVLQRAGDVWDETVVATGSTYRTRLLPGLEVGPDELLGPAGEA